jgi:hypothetical protein
LEKLEKVEADWIADSNDVYSTTYRKSYGKHHSYSSKPGYGTPDPTRYATPRELSFKYNQQDRINKDTDYARGKQPEKLWNAEKSSGLCQPRNPQSTLYD